MSEGDLSCTRPYLESLQSRMQPVAVVMTFALRVIASLIFVLWAGGGSDASAVESTPSSSARPDHRLRVAPAQTLSEILHRWAKLVAPKQRPPLYGEGGLITRTLALNPEIRDPERIYPGMKIRLPLYGDLKEEQVLSSTEIQQHVEDQASKPDAPRAATLTPRPSLPLPSPVPSFPVAESPLLPWSARGAFRLGTSTSRADELYLGKRSVTGNRGSFPRLEATVYFDEPADAGEAKLSPWEVAVTARLQINPTVSSLSFPATYGVEVQAIRARTLPCELGLGGALEWEPIIQGTPDRVALLSSATAPFALRKTDIVWAIGELRSPRLTWGRVPIDLGFGIGRSVVATSKASTGGVAIGSLTGWKLRAAAIAFELFHLMGHPVGFEARFERVGLSGQPEAVGVGPAGDTGISESTWSGFLRWDFSGTPHSAR